MGMIFPSANHWQTLSHIRCGFYIACLKWWVLRIPLVSGKQWARTHAFIVHVVKVVVDNQLIIYAFELTDSENDTWVEYTLEDEPTSIDNVNYDELKLDPNQPMYNVLGMLVDIHYKGVVIQNGKKFYLRWFINKYGDWAIMKLGWRLEYSILHLP